MSKIKHWDEATQSWVIDAASNALNIELSNPGYLDENGNSISVDQGFTKIDNRLTKIEHNVAWIYQNGAKGGGGGGGGGVIDSTTYNINIEEGTRVYTSNNSVTIHITITGGSVKKSFQVVVTDTNGNTKGTYVVTSLTRTEITINNLNDSTNRLTINANSGQNYAIPTSLTVIAGAIKLTQSTIPNTTIYPQNPVGQVILNVSNSTDSNLAIVVLCNGNQIDEFEIAKAKDTQFRVDSVVSFLDSAKLESIGETFVFEIYARGVLNDNVLQSNSITFSCTIVQPNTLYILTYNVNKSIPANNGDLANLTKFVYGNSIQFNYQLTYSRIAFSYYNIYYTISACYFEDGVLVEPEQYKVSGTLSRVAKDQNQQFLFNTSSLPDDTIYDPNSNQFKFVKVTLHAVSVDTDTIEDYKTLYFTLSEATTKYITATNFTNSLIGYFSPVMGVPSGNVDRWQYDNKNSRFPYSSQGTVQQRYISLVGHDLNQFMSQTDMQGVHLLGNSWVDLGINLFSGDANEVNLFNGNGWSLSFTFRTDANIDDSDIIASLGKYRDGELTAGIEIRANKVVYAVQTTQYILNITKGDLTTIDIIGERYVGPGDTETNPTHWFIKTYLNGVLSYITSHTSSEVFNIDNNGTYGWYFDDYLHIGGRVIDGIISDAASVHLYDFKVYSSAISDNEVIQNYISATIYSELQPNTTPNMSKQNELLQKNFIQIGTDGNYHSLLFDTSDETQYKDPTALLSSLVNALAESRIPYPIVVVNQLESDSNFLGITEAKFNEDLKQTVMNSRFPINIDYYTMGNLTPTRIENTTGTGMQIGIQGTSSLRYNSKNYEIYMGQDDEGKDVLTQIREDWLPENRYTLKADVMDSSHVNNVLIGRIINGLVSTTDAQGNVVPIKPLDNTPPMSKSGYAWADKVKHTSEGFPCILFINFKATGSNVSNCRCMGIYNFNLGRYAYFNLGLKLLTNVTYADTSETYPRAISSYTESTEVEAGAPVYSMEVQENSSIAMFDQDDPNILTEGVFEFPYDSDGQGMTNLGKLLTFLASFGYNIETDRKVYIDNDWKTPRLAKINGTWQESGRYYNSFDPVNYVKSTLDLHMNWNNMVSYYIIAIVFGLVDSMAKNLTLRSWGKSSSGDNIWYMCFYDMDTALRVNNVGAETVPYNAHLHRYYTDTTAIAEARVTNHCSSISGVFNQEYSGYNTRLQEIVENINVGYDSSNAKTLQSVYKTLRTNLFPDPAAFIDTYYGGQIGQVGAALYNYDYYLKYLQVEKTYNPATGQYGDNTYNYSEISYLHGNGSTNVKDWFVKRIKFLDGIYGMNGVVNGLDGITNTPLAQGWMDNNATYIANQSLPNITLLLQAESQIRVTIATSGDANSFWIDETKRAYKVNNVGARQVVTIYANNYLTSLGGFNTFTWDTIGSLTFPLIKELSLKDQKNIRSDNFLRNTNNLQSLVSLDLSGVTLLDSNSNIVYQPLTIAQQLPNLEVLDISNSSFSEVPLSQSSVLRDLNLSNTKIKTLSYSNQPMLETITIDGCNELETINLSDCPKLKRITVPASVKTVFLGNCQSLESIDASYSGSSNVISNLRSLIVTSCPNVKSVNLAYQNYEDLVVSLVGATGLEELYLQRLSTQNITLPEKSVWNSLRILDISNSLIGYMNYYGQHTESYMDLEQFTNLEIIRAADNTALQSVHCANSENHWIRLETKAFGGCTNLTNIQGSFILAGTRIFMGCSSFYINSPSIYSRYPVISYPVPFINDSQACNLKIDEAQSSLSEMFSGCSSLSGNDFSMVMLLLHDGVTNMSKMFLDCASANAIIRYDLFRHCPNVVDITNFAAGSGLRGGIYSRTSDYSESDTTTWGTFDFIRGVLSISNAFNSSALQFIDNDVFAPWQENGATKYFKLRDADYTFAYCNRMQSYRKYSTKEIIEGNLQSRDFFCNLRELGKFPKNMFVRCSNIYMDINSDPITVNGENTYFDYLFHFPYQIEMETLNATIYAGVNLVGEIHNNVFGGLQKQLGDNYIIDLSAISSPFGEGSNNITCNLSKMGNMFNNLKDTLYQAKGVFVGVDFTNSQIPIDIFSGCHNLNSISRFFATDKITNNGNVFVFPQFEMFKDCTSLKDVSFLFEGAYNLDIQLVGSGFRNCPLENVEGMLSSSGVFGMIPYKLFFVQNNTINNITGVFDKAFKLGYTRDRKLDITSNYVITQNEESINRKATWSDGIISVPGTRVDFQLDFTDFNGDDEWYIDGRDWATIKPSLASTQAYQNLSEAFDCDRQQAQALLDSRDREEGYQNYMFPADYLKYCSADCTMENPFKGFTYIENKLVATGTGKYTIQEGNKGGLRGRLPYKLLSNNIDNTEFYETFRDLDFCAFVNFNSYKFNSLGGTKQECRGIKFPPDLLRHNINLTSINSLFWGINVETGVDINSDLLENNVNLISVSSLFRNGTFNEKDFYQSEEGECPQFDYENLFKNCPNLQDVSNLFSIDSVETRLQGLRVINSSLFGTHDIGGQMVVNNPRITNVSGMFYNNGLMRGTIPLFDTGSYTRITKFSNYVDKVPKGNITNADVFISIHSGAWIPQSWID